MFWYILYFKILTCVCPGGSLVFPGYAATHMHTFVHIMSPISDWNRLGEIIAYELVLCPYVWMIVAGFHCKGMCECVIRIDKHERAPPMEWPVRRRRFKKEEISKLFHVEEDGRDFVLYSVGTNVFILFLCHRRGVAKALGPNLNGNAICRSCPPIV